MHITINREELLDKLELVGRVSVKHMTLPVLQCVLLDVKGTTFTVHATNLEIGIEASIQVKVEEEGSVAVPASILTQTVQYMQVKDVTFVLKKVY